MQRFRVTILAFMVLLLPAASAQQPPATSDAIGHPPPLPGPPPLAEPAAEPAPAAEISKNKSPSPAPAASEASPKGYIGAYAPPGTPPIPYSTGPLPTQDTGPGLNVIAPDGFSTKAVKAVPCGTVARETDGFTTCVGIPDTHAKNRQR